MQLISNILVQLALLIFASSGNCVTALALPHKSFSVDGISFAKFQQPALANHSAVNSHASLAQTAILPTFVKAVAPSSNVSVGLMEDVLVLLTDDKLHDRRLVWLARGAFLLLVGLALCLAIAAILLLACCIYDALSAWRHRARFRACQKQVRRVHEAFHSKRGDLPLCPYCVEHISDQRSPKKVVFLCGHRFHVACSNQFFKEYPHLNTQCPVCVGEEHNVFACRTGTCCDGRKALQSEVNDGALAFMLRSLRRQYPEIISEACVERWVFCHTEIWLSELTCPRYNSILGKQHK